MNKLNAVKLTAKQYKLLQQVAINVGYKMAIKDFKKLFNKQIKFKDSELKDFIKYSKFKV